MPLYLGGNEVRINIGDEVYKADFILANEAAEPVLDDSTNKNSSETNLE